jgi:drug/metabolite transporter (DMT)-like permease
MLNWVTYAVIAMSCNVGSILTFKYLRSISEDVFNNALNFLMYSGLIAVVILLFKKDSHFITPFYKKSIDKVALKVIGLVFVVAAFHFLNNYCKFISLTMAPNPGYATAIISFSAVIVTLFSIVCFNSHINMSTLIGVILSLIGLILIIRNSGN